MQDLDGDIAPDPRIARAIHFAHAACSEQGDDFIGPKTSARQQAASPAIVAKFRLSPFLKQRRYE